MCSATDCPRYSLCDHLPYRNVETNEITCGVYLDYKREQEYKSLDIDEKILSKIHSVVLGYGYRNIHCQIKIHITHVDFACIESQCERHMGDDLYDTDYTFKGYPVIEDSETFLEVCNKVKV